MKETAESNDQDKERKKEGKKEKKWKNENG